jgi:DNA-binding NtrC family response regulator
MSLVHRAKVLIIDDREDLLRFCTRSLGSSYEFSHVSSGRDAAAELAENPGVEAILLDRDFSRADPSALLGPAEDARNEGLHILRWLRASHPGIPVLMVTGYRDLHTAMEATDLGADFLAWQDLVEQPQILKARLERTLELQGRRPDGILMRFREMGMVSESPAFSRTLMALHQACAGNAPILLLGETGTGKDTLASAVHTLSGDASRPYVSVNVAALNPNLIESELFGYARGAYTGAGRMGVGKLRFADGGTLFLNEVAELPVDLQAKLLTALERNEVVPVGEVNSYPARFRLICATSRDIGLLVQEGRFRRDLYHRIAWHTIMIPPLRERREDIPALVRTFLREAGQTRQGIVLGIAKEALEHLGELSWEGNVRELRATLEAASATARAVITLQDVREVVRRNEVLRRPACMPADAGGPEVERRLSACGPWLDPRSGVVVTPGTVVMPGITPSSSLAAAPEAGTAALSPVSADCETAAFGSLSFRDLTERYYRYLMRVTGGRLPEVARRAGIAKGTAYEWKNRFDPACSETEDETP